MRNSPDVVSALERQKSGETPVAGEKERVVVFSEVAREDPHHPEREGDDQSQGEERERP